MIYKLLPAPQQVTSSNSHVVVGIAILAVVLLISPVIIVLVRMVTRTLQVSAGSDGQQQGQSANDRVSKSLKSGYGKNIQSLTDD